MTRERTHRRRRGARVPSHRVAHTPAHPAPHKRAKVRTGRSRPGCVTVAGRLPRRRAEPGVHMPRVLGAPPHTAHGPGSRLDCRTQAAPSRAGFGGGWVVGARAQEKLAPHGLRGSTCRTCRPPGGRWKNMPHGHRGAVEEHAARPPGARAGLTRAGLRGRARAARAGLRGHWEARDVRPPPPPST